MLTTPKKYNAYIEYYSEKKKLILVFDKLNAAEVRTLEEKCGAKGVQGASVINIKNGSLNFVVEASSEAELNKILHKIETKQVNDRPVQDPDFKFVKSANTLRGEATTAQRELSAAISPVLHIHSTKAGIEVEIEKSPATMLDTVTEVLSLLKDKIKPVKQAPEQHGNSVKFLLQDTKDAVIFYDTFKTRANLADAPHAMHHKLSQAQQKERKAIFEVEGKKTGVYVTVTRGPNNTGELMQSALVSVNFLSDMVIGHEGAITLSFRGGDDATKFYHKLRDNLADANNIDPKHVFTEGDAVIKRSIEKAASHAAALHRPR